MYGVRSKTCGGCTNAKFLTSNSDDSTATPYLLPYR